MQLRDRDYAHTHTHRQTDNCSHSHNHCKESETVPTDWMRWIVECIRFLSLSHISIRPSVSLYWEIATLTSWWCWRLAKPSHTKPKHLSYVLARALALANTFSITCSKSNINSPEQKKKRKRKKKQMVFFSTRLIDCFILFGELKSHNQMA